MKPILVAALAILSLGTAQAVEYVTLTHQSRNLNLNSTDLVEVVGYIPKRSRGIKVDLTFADGTILTEYVGGWLAGADFTESTSSLGQKYTGLTSIQKGPTGDNQAVTLKITRATEINAVTPSAVLVLPENSTGDYDVVIEASDDLVSWLPFFSQTVNSQAAKKFFRTRVVRSEAPAQKP